MGGSGLWHPSPEALSGLRGCDHIEMRPGGREEIVGGMGEDYPYALVLSQHDRYQNRSVPWHWHQELELFYVLDGTVDYATPHVHVTLPAGAAGLVNANVLHMTRATGGCEGVNLLIHMPRPHLLAERGSLIWRRYVEPLTSATSVELLYVLPDDESARMLRSDMQASFDVVLAGEKGWELELRNTLAEVWLDFVGLAGERVGEGAAAMPCQRDERLKAMVDYVGRHYDERIGVAQIAAAAFASERECYRTFRECLGVTPGQYLRDYRIQQACRMLAHTTRPISAVADMAGMGGASHFGREFRAAMGCTPTEYRRKWQDFNSSRQNVI
ncbi:MAG TPA: AraC family transcriptional regulator [Candidatus Olsenella stercoravium]|uniref:AraC family transcriptional regulator n=1 Tax=Candidatus Olsenella stercoravium TaxID=2838713 RepID=A0A9D2IQ42_9ACTN|nr:AraC family transcriptional regulator [Candidatus Olsenella stercoravium]